MAALLPIAVLREEARMFTKLLTTAGVLASLSAYAAELPPMTFMCGSEYAGDPQYTKDVTVRDRMRHARS
jgi:hypothetical protein